MSDICFGDRAEEHGLGRAAVRHAAVEPVEGVEAARDPARSPVR